jgi:hypothetical protein
MTETDTAATTAAPVAPVAARTVLDRLGGWRGLVDGAVPPLALVATNAGLGLLGHDDRALPVAVAVAAGSAALLGALRVAGGHSVGGVLRGLAGLAMAVVFALWTGRARDFFLPGIYVDAAYAVGLAASALVGHPLVGHAYALLLGLGPTWRDDRRLRRVMAVATWGWSAVYVLRAVVQGLLYSVDEPELLALAKLVLGWPLTAVAVLLTLRAARRTRSGHGRTS